MLEAIFPAGVDEIEVNGLTQWDKGQILRVSFPDMPTIYQVHFTFRGGKEALIVHVLDGAASNDVEIPNELLMQPHDLIAYVYLFDSEGAGETVKTVYLPLVRRAKPEDYASEITPTQAEKIDMMLAEIKSIAESAERLANNSKNAADDSAAAASAAAQSSANSASAAAQSATAARAAQSAAEEVSNNVNKAIEDANAALEQVQEIAEYAATEYTYTAAVPLAWVEDTANGGYYQTIAVAGILAGDNPIIDVVMGADAAANILYEKAFALIGRIATAADSITLYAYKKAPETALNIQIKVVR